MNQSKLLSTGMLAISLLPLGCAPASTSQRSPVAESAKKTRPLSASSQAARTKAQEARQAITASNFSLAEERFLQSLQLQDNLQVRAAFANFLRSRGRNANALDQYCLVIQGSSTSTSVSQKSIGFVGQIADLAYDLNDPRAGGLYDLAISLGHLPSSGPALNLPANATVSQRRAAARILMGTALHFRDKQAGRLKILQALEDDPQSAIGRYYLAYVAWKQHDLSYSGQQIDLARPLAHGRPDLLASLDELEEKVR